MGVRLEDELKGVGRGHVMRCITLAHKIRQLRPDVEVRFAACGMECEIAKKQGFKTTKVPIVGYNSLLSEEIRRVEHESNLLRVLEPSVVISDTHEAALLASKICGIPCVAVFNPPFVTWYPVLALLADLILIPDIKEALDIPGFLQNKKEVYFTGPLISGDPKRHNDRQMIRRKLKIDENVKFITVYAGRESGDRETFLANVVGGFKLLREFRSNLEILIVASKRENIQVEGEGIRVVEYVSGLTEYLYVSDLAIARGGQVFSMEAAALGVQTIMVPIRGDAEQEFNAERMEKLGYAIYMSVGELNPRLLSDTINSILENGERKAKSKPLNWQGAGKAASLILGLLERH